MPFEGMDSPFDFDFYHPVPTGMVPNDELGLQVVWACLLDQMETPEVSQTLFSKAWRVRRRRKAFRAKALFRC
jgi:hypothetical protein